MAAWLFKTEPGDFSFDDLAKQKSARWDGVRNPTALRNLASAKVGDVVVLYHTGDEKRAVGLAKVVRAPYADPDQPALDGQGKPKFMVIDLAAERRASTPLSLEKIKADKRFAQFLLVKNSRLSVMPVPQELDQILREWAEL